VRRAVLGGTFDPLHVGHLAIAEAARRTERLDEVLFVTASRNPLKTDPPEVAAEARHEMVRLALDGLPAMRASRAELDRPEPSYTVDTLREFARDGSELFLVVGADAAARFAEWRQADEIARIATVLVARRPGFADPALTTTFPAGRARLLSAPLVDLSSSELRAFARTGGSLRYLVPDPAWRYAAAGGLYGQREDF
jgi:nicotinate-nucleotide adenylyltransferase